MKKILKWAGVVAGGLLLLILLALGTIYLIVGRQLNETIDVTPVALAVPARPDSALLARGAHLADLHACTGCHGADLSGDMLFDDPAMGHLAAANLTPGRGGIGGRYAVADWVRAIRHGVAADGRALLIMPSAQFVDIGRADLEALVAYLQSLPPVDHVLPARSIGPMGRVMVLTAGEEMVPAHVIDHSVPLREAPVPGVTATYGRYLATTCTHCHGEGLTGGLTVGPPGTPPSADLTALGDWTRSDFARALRQGVTPAGDSLSMPRWPSLTDDEITAIWRYLQALTPPPPVAGR